MHKMRAKSTSKTNSWTSSGSSFDFRSYISRYDAKSETRIQRLLHLAKSGVSPTAAYGMLERQLKDGGNYTRYREVFGNCPPSISASTSASAIVDGDCVMDMDGTGVGANVNVNVNVSNDDQEDIHAASKYGFKFDANFATMAEENAHQQSLTLESNLNTAQSLLSKECIRQSYLDLAQLCTATGRTPDALNYLRRAKEYSSSSYHTQDIILLMAATGLNSHNYAIVRNLYDPVTGTGASTGTGGRGSSKSSSSSSGGVGSSNTFLSKLNAARGLAYLAEGKFKQAASSFMAIQGNDLTSSSTSADGSGNGFNHIISSHDIALYGGLMALLALERTAIASTLVDKETPFRGRLDHVPLLRDAIRCYVRAEYGECLKLIDRLRVDWDKDIYLKPHAKTLWKKVRGKCLLQYFEPYSAVSLQSMTESFAFESVDEAEEVVVDLIESKEIVGAKIQGVERTLTKFSVDELEQNRRRRMMRKLGRVGDGLVDEVEGMILRMACLDNNIIVGKKGRSGGKSRGRRRDWGVAMSKGAWGLDSSDDDEITPMEADEDILMDCE